MSCLSSRCNGAVDLDVSSSSYCRLALGPHLDSHTRPEPIESSERIDWFEPVAVSERIVRPLLGAMESTLKGELYLGQEYSMWKIMKGFAAMSAVEANQEVLVKAGLLPLLTECLTREFYHAERVQEQACAVAWQLAFNEKCREEMLREGALRGVLR